MFNLFKKKEEKPSKQLNWERQDTFDQYLKIISANDQRIISLLKDIMKKEKITNDSDEILNGLKSWVGPEGKLGYGLLIYIGTSIMDKLSNIEKLLKSNIQSDNGNN